MAKAIERPENINPPIVFDETEFEEEQNRKEIEGYVVIGEGNIEEVDENIFLSFRTIAAMCRITDAVHDKKEHLNQKWAFYTSSPSIHSKWQTVACRVKDFKAVAFFSREAKKANIVFLEQEISWWNWIWGSSSKIPIDIIKKLVNEIMVYTHRTFPLEDEDNITYETMGFLNGALLADVAGAALINNGANCTITTFENPGSRLILENLINQGHFPNLLHLPADFSEKFNPWLSLANKEKTLTLQYAETIKVPIYDSQWEKHQPRIEEFLNIFMGREIQNIEVIDREEIIDDLPPPLLELEESVEVAGYVLENEDEEGWII